MYTELKIKIKSANLLPIVNIVVFVLDIKRKDSGLRSANRNKLPVYTSISHWILFFGYSDSWVLLLLLRLWLCMDGRMAFVHTNDALCVRVCNGNGNRITYGTESWGAIVCDNNARQRRLFLAHGLDGVIFNIFRMCVQCARVFCRLSYTDNKPATDYNILYICTCACVNVYLYVYLYRWCTSNRPSFKVLTRMLPSAVLFNTVLPCNLLTWICARAQTMRRQYRKAEETLNQHSLYLEYLVV